MGTKTKLAVSLLILVVTAAVLLADSGTPGIAQGVIFLLILGGFIFLSMSKAFHTPLVACLLLLGNYSYGARVLGVNQIILFCLVFVLVWIVLRDGLRTSNAHVAVMAFCALLMWVSACIVSGNSFDVDILLHHFEGLLIAIFAALWIGRSEYDFVDIGKVYLLLLCAYGSAEAIFAPKPRLCGPLGSATAYAASLVTFWTLHFFSCYYLKRFSAFNLIIAFWAALIILLTGTRSAIIGICAALFLAILLDPNRVLSKKLLLQVLGGVSVAIAVAVIWSLLPKTLMVKQTFSSIDLSNRKIDGSSLGRLAAWWIVIKTFPQHPFFGIGIGQFPEYAWKFFPIIRLPHAHNIFMATLAETGLIGLVILIAIMLNGLHALWSMENKCIKSILLGTGIVALIMGQLDNMPLYPTTVLWGGFLYGIAVKSPHLANRKYA